MNAQVAAAAANLNTMDSTTQNSENTTSSTENMMFKVEPQALPSQHTHQQTICLPGVTIHVSSLCLQQKIRRCCWQTKAIKMLQNKFRSSETLVEQKAIQLYFTYDLVIIGGEDIFSFS